MNDQIQTDSNEPTELLAPTSTAGLSFINPNEMPDLDNAESGVSLEMKYYEFKEAGTVVRAIYNGMTQINKRNNEGGMDHLDAVVFQTKEGIFLNGGDNLIGQLRNLAYGMPIEITYDGKQKTGGGNNVNKFTVRLLNVPGYAPKLSAPSATVAQSRPAQKTQVNDETRLGLFAEHKMLWNKASNMGLLVLENIAIWKVSDASTNADIEARIALIEGAVNFGE